MPLPSGAHTLPKLPLYLHYVVQVPTTPRGRIVSGIGLCLRASSLYPLPTDGTPALLTPVPCLYPDFPGGLDPRDICKPDFEHTTGGAACCCWPGVALPAKPRAGTGSEGQGGAGAQWVSRAKTEGGIFG